MKQLMLLRHAKAMSAAPGTADRERPLAERGVRDAGLMGTAMAAEPPPISSSVRRRDAPARPWRR